MSISDRLDTIENGWKPKIFKKIFLDRIEYLDKNGNQHNENDLPAVIYKSGTNIWYKNGKCHRDGDEPAFILGSGTKIWYKNNKKHRNNGEPAVV